MKKGTAIIFAVGVFAGMALCGPASAAVQRCTASPSAQTFYVDGQRVQLEAYEIHGNNFVKLRDIGQAVNFAVDYDGSTNSVRVNSALPYQEEAAPAKPVPSAAVTEESVQSALAALREQYPNGALWLSPYRSASGGPYHSGMNCAGWAILCSDAAFGGLPWRRVDSPTWDQLRPGDLVEYDNDLGGHVIVVVSKTSDTITFTDSGPTQKAYWGGQYPRWWLEEQPGLILYTRYPN